MKYILILLLTIPLLYSNDYSVIIKKPFNENLQDITQDYDREISVIGYANNYDSTNQQVEDVYTNPFDYLDSFSNKYGANINLIKLDNKANITLNKKIYTKDFAKAVSIIKTPTNGYFIGGYTLNGSLIVLKLDSKGDTLFSKIFGTKNKDKMNHLVPLKDGGILSVGYSRTSRSPLDNKFESGLGGDDIYLTKFSKNGKKLWSKKYGTENDDNAIDAVESDDGSLIIVSTTETTQNRVVSFMRLTQNGDMIWKMKYQSEDYITPHKIIKLRDNNFVVALSKKDNLHNDQIKLIKLNLHKKILRDEDIYTDYSSVLVDIKEFSNGNIIGVGYVEDSYNRDALAMLVNRDLKLLTQNHFGDDNFDTFNAVTILHNSQIAAAGIHTDVNLEESNMWIVKLTRGLDIVKLKKSYIEKKSTLLTQLNTIFKDEITNGKLEIKDDLTIEFSDDKLYFRVARYKLTKQQKDFLTKFSKKLIPFLENNKQNIKTIEINGHTSSEWGNLDFTNDYLKNQKLSMNRAYSTLEFIFKNQDEKTKVLLSKIFKGSGLSFSKKVMVNNDEDKKRSRRVSFKIVLNDTKR